MHTESPVIDYFDTPQRTERLQLLVHLLNNAEDVPYLRAPPGAGKTRFALRLAEQLGDDYAVVWLVGGHFTSVFDAVCTELAVEPDELDWPAGVLEASDRPSLLLIVDDADALDLKAITDLFALHELGVRLLFIGNGGLSQVQGSWDLQFVDLPPFTEEQSLAFMAGVAAGRTTQLGDAAARGLHRAADGWPGHLVNALTAIPAAPMPPPAAAGPAVVARRVPWGMVGLGVALVVLLAVGLMFQDRINDLFETPPGDIAELPPVAPIERPRPVPVSPALPPPPVATPAQPHTPVPAERSTMAEAPDSGEQPDELPNPEAVSGLPAGEPSPGGSVAVTEAPPMEPAAPQSDDVLDAVIEAAIAAAEQPPAAQLDTPLDAAAGDGEAVAAEVAGEVAPEAAGAVAESADAPPPVQPAPAPEPAPEPAPVPARGVTPSPKPGADQAAAGLAWLRGQAPARYTLQLVGARERSAIDKFIREHKVEAPYAVFTRQLAGKPWYSLVAGSYPDRDAAVAARAALEGFDGSGIWPRTFASIREQMID